MIGKGNYRHYMLKEIFEQPSAIGDTLGAYYNPGAQRVALPALPFALEQHRTGDRRRLRDLLLRGPRRALLDRADRSGAGGDRHRVGVPLPRAAAG